MTQSSEPAEVLFYEQGASWLWVLAGPVSAIAMLLIQLSAGYGIQLLVPAIFFLLVTGFIAIQVKAARIHTSVELTPTMLREGTERIQIDDIVRIYPEAPGPEAPKWQSARALGELTGVPKRPHRHRAQADATTATAQAWARKHQQLRAALIHLVDERIPAGAHTMRPSRRADPRTAAGRRRCGRLRAGSARSRSSTVDVPPILHE